MKILVIDDNKFVLRSLCQLLNNLGHEAQGHEDPSLALAAVKEQSYSLVLLPYTFISTDSFDILDELRAEPSASGTAFVMHGQHCDPAIIIEAYRHGVSDFFNEAAKPESLALLLDRLFPQGKMPDLTAAQTISVANPGRCEDTPKETAAADNEQPVYQRDIAGMGLVLATSEVMRRLLHEALILHDAPTVPVLIEGETGVGKEIFARLVHHGQGVNTNPFVAINCAAIPHDLFESELFGHDPGAYTGSKAAGSPGKLELAGNGTLFLDEVAEMPITLQPKLLRVLEERTFYRVGGLKKRRFAARIVCAGNRNMFEMLARKTFRSDLYHRLRVGHLQIPPLRERIDDIKLLANFFLEREAKQKHKQFKSIASDSLDMLSRYPWPGNVRELENTIERAVLMHNSDTLLPAHLDFLVQGVAPTFTPAGSSFQSASGNDTLPTSDFSALGIGPEIPPSPVTSADYIQQPGFDLRDIGSIILPEHGLNLDELTVAIIKAALRRFNGNKTKTAEYLGISRFALHRRIQSMTSSTM